MEQLRKLDYLPVSALQQIAAVPEPRAFHLSEEYHARRWKPAPLQG